MSQIDAVYQLARSAALARFRILSVEGEEHPDRSWLRITCHNHREDLPWATIPLLHALGTLSFGDARPRGSSGIDYQDGDEWTAADLLQRLRFERGRLGLEADYVRGRMMKTTVSVDAQGRMTVEARNRHEMALRWLGSLKGRKHLRLAGEA